MNISTSLSRQHIVAALAALFLGLFSHPALADWQLDADNSHLSYGSIKKNSIGESNHFQKIDGRISEDGDITLVIDLASVETWVDIRNTRMMKFLFNTEEFAVATLTGQVDMDSFNNLEVGEKVTLDVAFSLNLHGSQQPLEAELVVLRLAKDKVVVLPHEIIFLDAEKFGLLPGLKKLEELAKLPSISSAVPLAFYLTFNHTP